MLMSDCWVIDDLRHHSVTAWLKGYIVVMRLPQYNPSSV
uniref:Uncharacterized protein n=1 Tax=Setaria italica TaxID=4555 RepID=K3Z1F4_SETIT